MLACALNIFEAMDFLAIAPWLRLEKAMSLKEAKNTPSSGATDPSGFNELLAKVGASRDQDAFVTLFNYYAPRVKSWLLKNGMADAAAEEVVQNTFVTVWEKAAQYSPKKAAASTWIFTIARNKRIDALRRDKNLDVNSDSLALENAVAETNTEYADAEDIERLNSAMETLPPEQAELLRMAFFDDMSHSDISTKTKLPLGTVKSRLRLAMDKLRGMLQMGSAS